ncbi:MAG TPA: NADH-quinone oxidoreductase subunit D [Polyangiaceae bacterium]|nr:MAG: NADH-quinone oxidoreductase subunit D [Deltaproteobacteria bacterium ADurb.Bin207]HNS95676.1 NADH-quinone oxidoreductase subunit D [Polyangiaceae bacterium]HNZ25322.1 NADH-quinone oxidoreductase subunit D [Polyangiaceae bacterium]HOD24934.1 NADH-quinone oxidoreductase subunit D [Polyangiaceae bacterium]HOE50391.1 NADH-quinone oxidoreductase subunit D [Polyangiaceae bacterium]
MAEVIVTQAPDGEEMSLNMGPHHPSTHGVLRFILHTDGEIISRAIPDVGFLHRSIEKIGERNTLAGFMPYTDRVDYLAAMFCNEVWAIAAEKLLAVEVPPRAQYLRCIAGELNRIISHLIGLGCMAMDLGAFTPFVQALREREFVNDFIEELCGARLTYNYCRIGGVSHDVPNDTWKSRVLEWIEHFLPMVDEFDRLITYNEIFVQRCANIAVISGKEAIDWGLVGPNLRGSGVPRDVRRDDPYGVYPQLEFEIPIGRGKMGTVGDCFDRFLVRVDEMRESAKIVRQALLRMDEHPKGEIRGTLPKKLKFDGEVYAHVESARGDLGCYVIGHGQEQPYRVRFRTGSFTAMGIIEPKSPGLFVADMVALISSFDVVAPEIDR